MNKFHHSVYRKAHRSFRINAPLHRNGCTVYFRMSAPFGRNLQQLSDQWLSCENPQTESIIQEFASPDQTWTSFSALPLVIMYNTNVVTYRELPVGWESLLEPRWKGRVALVDPKVSGIGGFALAAAHITGPDQEDYVKKLAENQKNCLTLRMQSYIILNVSLRGSLCSLTLDLFCISPARN